MHYRISEFDAVLWDGKTFAVEIKANDAIKLSCIGDINRHLSMARDQFDALLEQGGAQILYAHFSDRFAARNARMGQKALNSLTEEQRSRAIYKQVACEVFAEAHANGEVKKTEQSYKAFFGEFSTRIADRMAQVCKSAKGALRAGDKLDRRKLPTLKTLRGWLNRYLPHRDVFACVPDYFKIGRNARRIPPEVEDVIASKIGGYLDPSKPTMFSIFELVEAEIRAQNKVRQDQGLPSLKCPSFSTVQARIGALDKFEVHAARHGIASAKQKYGPYGGGMFADFPLQRVEIDDWEVDVLILCKLMKLQLTKEQVQSLGTARYALCVAMDCATRCILGFHLAPNPSSAGTLQTIWMCMRDKTELARSLGCASPWDQYGHIGELCCDNGSAFVSEEVRWALCHLGIDYHVLPAGVPKLRGRIERLFRTMSTSLMPLLTGQTFSNPIERGDYPAEQFAALYADDLAKIIVTFFVDIYHNRPHAGLAYEAPAACWRRLHNEGGVLQPLPAHAICSALGVPVERQTGRHGVRVCGLHYHSEELARRVMAVGNEKLTVRLDPQDVGYVSALIDGAWYRLDCTLPAASGLPMEVWRQAALELRTNNRRKAIDDAEIVTAAIKRIVAQNEAALLRQHIEPYRITADEIDRAEDEVFLGVDIGSHQPEGPAEGPSDTSITNTAAPETRARSGADTSRIQPKKWSFRNDT